MALKQKLTIFLKNFQVLTGPVPTCKGPEGDKLQGTIVHHFFVSILVLIIQGLTKSLEMFLPKLRKSAILAQIFPFLAQNGGGGIFKKNLFRTLLSISIFPTSCQILRKSLEPFSGKVHHGRTDGLTAGHTHRWTRVIL